MIPVKGLTNAKTRLSPVLSPGERRQLFILMLEDVLAALSTAQGLAGIMMVTGDSEAGVLATRYGAGVLQEARGNGQSAAVAAAARALCDTGAAAMLALPADVPLVTAAEIETMLAAQGPAPAVTIAPAVDRRGTNGLLCSPPDLIPFHFGDDSFQPHRQEARRLGIEPVVLDLPGFGLDIDRPADLLELSTRPTTSRAQAWLQENGIVRRLGRPAT